MSNKDTVKKYFNKYFKNQFFKETDSEFKSLVRILNKKNKEISELKNTSETYLQNWRQAEKEKAEIKENQAVKQIKCKHVTCSIDGDCPFVRDESVICPLNN